jgi:Ca2+-transporting ATPase
MQLSGLAGFIAKAGLVVGATLFAALLIRFLVQLGKHNPPRTASQHGSVFAHILIISVTVVVVAVPEGLLVFYSWFV